MAHNPGMDALPAFVFGATVAAAIGPIALLIVHNGLHHGLRAAAASALGVALADLTYAVAAFASGAALTAALDAHRRLLSMSASALLALLGLWLLAESIQRWRTGRAPEPARAIGLRPAYLLTLANPLTLVLFAGFAARSDSVPSWPQAARNAAALFLGSLFVQMVFALGGAGLRRGVRSPRVIAGAGITSALGICLFGAWGLIDSV